MTLETGSITPWIERLKAGDDAALQPLWERYFRLILRHARSRLPRGAGFDSEGIVVSAFKSFWRAARAGRFPRLNDRHDLWQLLIVITNRKIIDAWHKNGRRASVGEGPLLALAAAEPTPEFVVAIAEELEALLDRLGDDRLRKIALWKMEGDTNQVIADRLELSLRTVANKLNLIRAILQRPR
jgi:DNA-directed RNA polymerase specialized sigma24 family protein